MRKREKQRSLEERRGRHLEMRKGREVVGDAVKCTEGGEKGIS